MDDREWFIPAYGVHERRAIPIDSLVDALRRDGWPTYILAGEPASAEAFFAAVGNSMPLDPPVSPERVVWDALEDSMWEAIHKLRVEKVAIVWPGSNRLLKADPAAYVTALDVFRQLVFNLADRKFTVDHETRVLALLG